ncbi:MAG: hypothetical protein F2840_17205 [Actinobacteria bacterium]|uniref:Unannotated protein n=1 Tax=freshwater metagenome TaxID=449393 RepID=A0A6J7M318_9ZZZZ|nr:hypothetical protein [Actinomycetota bacterium]
MRTAAILAILVVFQYSRALWLFRSGPRTARVIDTKTGKYVENEVVTHHMELTAATT